MINHSYYSRNAFQNWNVAIAPRICVRSIQGSFLLKTGYWHMQKRNGSWVSIRPWQVWRVIFLSPSESADAIGAAWGWTTERNLHSVLLSLCYEEHFLVSLYKSGCWNKSKSDQKNSPTLLLGDILRRYYSPWWFLMLSGIWKYTFLQTD